jgi:hypothetical protein
MNLRYAIVVVILGAGACTPAPETEVDAKGTAPAASAPLPACSAVEASDAGVDGWKHPDCQLNGTAPAQPRIEIRYAGAEDDSTEVAARVIGPDGAVIQEIIERMGNTFNGPSLQDVDADGLTDILLPLETGNVNTTFALWRQTASGRFVRAGELNGVAIEKTPSGFIAVQGRSSAAEYYVDFYRLQADALSLVSTTRIAAIIEDDDSPGLDCTSESPAGVEPSAFGLSDPCSEPVVRRMAKDMGLIP